MGSPFILVTGGAGYIGSHACKALAQSGYTPVVFDNLVYGHEWAVKWGPLVVGDIQDGAALRSAIRQYEPEAIMHFAAFAYVGESVTDPGKYYRNNVAGTLTLLETMRETGINKLVFSSTCATYGVPEQIPISETTHQSPINPYGASKLMVERMLADFRTAHGLRSISLRYFNAAGADPDGEIGEDHNPETHLIPLVLDAAIGKRASVSIFGSDYDTKDGTCIRDYIHVNDLADAHVLALKRLHDDTARPAYNLGTGEGISVKEVIDEARRITGRPINAEMMPRRAGDPPVLVADASRARIELGFSPKSSDLTTLLKTAWAWHQRWA